MNEYLIYFFLVISIIYTLVSPYIFLWTKNYNEKLRDPKLFIDFIIIINPCLVNKRKGFLIYMYNYIVASVIDIFIYLVLLIVCLIFIDTDYLAVLITSILITLLFVIQLITLILFFNKFTYKEYKKNMAMSIDPKSLTNPFLKKWNHDITITIKKNNSTSLRSNILNKNTMKLHRKLNTTNSAQEKYILLFKYLCGCSQMINFMERGSEWESLDLYVDGKQVDKYDFKEILTKKLCYIYSTSFAN